MRAQPGRTREWTGFFFSIACIAWLTAVPSGPARGQRITTPSTMLLTVVFP